MNALRIQASHSMEWPAAETPTNLAETLRELTGRPGPRRVSRLVRLALLGARQCLGNRQLPADSAVLLTTRTGPVADTVTLLQQGAAGLPLPPVQFVNVSSNMVSYYLAAELGVQGSNQVILSREHAWFGLLETAQLTLPPGTPVLLGAVEENLWPLAEHRQRLGLADEAPLGDSSHWLLVETGEGPGPCITALERHPDDQAMRARLRQCPPETTLTLTANARQALPERPPCPSAAPSQLQNGLPDAHAVIHWLAELTGPGWWLDRSPRGHWVIIAAQA